MWRFFLVRAPGRTIDETLRSSVQPRNLLLGMSGTAARKSGPRDVPCREDTGCSHGGSFHEGWTRGLALREEPTLPSPGD